MLISELFSFFLKIQSNPPKKGKNCPKKGKKWSKNKTPGAWRPSLLLNLGGVEAEYGGADTEFRVVEAEYADRVWGVQSESPPECGALTPSPGTVEPQYRGRGDRVHSRQ